MSGELRLSETSVLALDEYGHLADPTTWSEAVAEAMASLDGLALTTGHWQVISIIREHYESFGVETPMRILVKRMRERTGNERLASRDLYRLFPEGPVRQGSRYGGLPIPLSCI